jgi:hypothetical protein
VRLYKVTEIVVSTAATADGHRLTEEELRRQVVDPVNGPFAGAYRFVQDRSVAPRGKIISARIRRENGEVLACHTAAPYMNSGKTIIVADGTTLKEELCKEDSRQITGFGVTKSYRIHVNPMDFESQADFDSFVDEVSSAQLKIHGQNS